MQVPSGDNIWWRRLDYPAHGVGLLGILSNGGPACLQGHGVDGSDFLPDKGASRGGTREDRLSVLDRCVGARLQESGIEQHCANLPARKDMPAPVLIENGIDRVGQRSGGIS